MPSVTRRIDLEAVRARLAGATGPRYWRTLEELADTPELQALLEEEFPRHASVWPEGLSRRHFIGLMGASLALGGLSGCTVPPGEQIVPYVRQPEGVVPGQASFYATAMSLGAGAVGLLVESHTGRPTKVEGNPDHPASRGTTDLFAQASILTLYDPDRAAAVTYQGRPRLYADFVADLEAALAAERPRRGAGLRILTESVTSPSLAAQIGEIIAALPGARWHQYEPLAAGDGAHGGARLAFGRPLASRYRFDVADVVVALDADFLACTPANLRYVGDFAARRRVRESGPPPMNRLYAVEPALTLTGAMADHRVAMRAADVAPFAAALAARLGVEVGPLSHDLPAAVPSRWLDALVRDLGNSRGRSVVLAGEGQPAAVHALAHAINASLGNAGHTVTYAEPVEANVVDHVASLRELTTDMEAGRVQVLLILGGNPVYTAPADVDFKNALLRVALPVHLALYRNETSVRCRWQVPAAHYLESWGDTRAWNGAVTLVQPLIAPLYDGKTPYEILAAVEGRARTSYDVVRDFWRGRHGGADFEAWWRRCLHDGVVPGTESPPARAAVRAGWTGQAAARQPAARQGLELVFRADPSVYDGRFANNGWLQELPSPITKITWGNAALVSPRTAQRLGVTSEDVVELTYRGRRVQAPVWVQPGQAEDSVTVHLGYGRTLAGRVGNGVGFDAYSLRTAEAPWFGDGLAVRKTGQRQPLAVTSRHHSMNGRDLVISGTLAEFKENPDLVHARPRARDEERERAAVGRPLTLYPLGENPHEYAWGMAIDLSACTGCNACVTACYAENNIPVVGAAQVSLGRIMQWIRVDTYYAGDLDAPRAYHQPVPCMHCEKAPCEVVCPVGATVHSREGLNEMVYNRCVGTRYCSNNCPYKVRRFNFFQYADWRTPTLMLQRNPEVTVRSRGVMEKCTYCVQRLTAARIAAEKADRRVRDGEATTACAQACPTQAIVFGDLNDPASRVRRIKASPLNYALLGELGTRPRTTYLAAIRNPNPALDGV